MRTPAQQAASRANGARSRGPKTAIVEPILSMDALRLKQLTKITVLTNESRTLFHELVRQHMLRIAPRDAVELAAVEEICSATWRLYRLRAIERKIIDLELANQSSPDDLECLARACGALADNYRHFHLSQQRYETRLQNIIRRSLARIRILRQLGENKEFFQTTPSEHTTEGPQCAPEP